MSERWKSKLLDGGGGGGAKDLCGDTKDYFSLKN
jgi:hypothetical protein